MGKGAAGGAVGKHVGGQAALECETSCPRRVMRLLLLSAGTDGATPSVGAASAAQPGSGSEGSHDESDNASASAGKLMVAAARADGLHIHWRDLLPGVPGKRVSNQLRCIPGTLAVSAECAQPLHPPAPFHACLAQYLSWTQVEVEALLVGVARFSTGWKKILEWMREEELIHPSRTAVGWSQSAMLIGGMLLRAGSMHPLLTARRPT